VACLARLLAKAFGVALAKAGYKNPVLSKFFRNFVPKFREQMANDKHYPKGKPKGKHL
jgi:hypothetical protein